VIDAHLAHGNDGCGTLEDHCSPCAAERLGFTDYSDVLAEVANAVTRKTANPEGNPPNAVPALLGE
jgi:hypothetical protein